MSRLLEAITWGIITLTLGGVLIGFMSNSELILIGALSIAAASILPIAYSLLKGAS